MLDEASCNAFPAACVSTGRDFFEIIFALEYTGGGWEGASNVDTRPVAPCLTLPMFSYSTVGSSYTTDPTKIG